MKDYKEIKRKEIERSQEFGTPEVFKHRIDIYMSGEVYADGTLVRLIGKIDLDEFIHPEEFVSKYNGFYYGELPDGAAKHITLLVNRDVRIHVYISVGYTCGGFTSSYYTWRHYKTPEELEDLWEEYDLPVYYEEA